MNFKIITYNEREEWSRYIKCLPIEQQDIYFTPEYYHLYEENGDGVAQCVVFIDNDNIALYPYLKNEINSLGFKLKGKYFDIQGAYGYNGVIASCFNNNFKSKFYKILNGFFHEENIIAEFTRFHPLIKNHSFSKNNLEVIYNRKTIHIDLQTNYKEIYYNFQRTTRKQINRSINRYNIEVRNFENKYIPLDLFIEIYNETMDRVNSISYLRFNRNYFKSLINYLPSVCFVAYHEQMPIASIIALYNEYYIHGHLGGSLSKYLHMSPYSLLYSEMIKFGQSKGCRVLHLGGGTSSSENDSLLDFKFNFSKQTSDFFIGKRIHNEKIYEETVKQWTNKFPEKKMIYSQMILKYRL